MQEEKLHLYVINKSLLPKEDIDEIESGIRSDAGLRDKIDLFSKIHKSAQEIKLPDHEIDKIIAALLKIRNNKIELKSLYEEEDDSELKLAAMNSGNQNDDFTYFNTYASADNFTLIRVLKNPGEGNFRFYAISEDSESSANAVLKLSGDKETLITNDNGIAELKSDFLDKNISLNFYPAVDKFNIPTYSTDQFLKSDKANSLTSLKLSLSDSGFEAEFPAGYLKDRECFAVYDNDYSGFSKPKIISENKVLFETEFPKVKSIKLIIILK